MLDISYNKFSVSRQLDRDNIIEHIKQNGAQINSSVSHINQSDYNKLDILREHISSSREILDSIESDVLLLDHLNQPNMNMGDLISELELFDPDREVITDFKELLISWALLPYRFNESHALIQTIQPDRIYLMYGEYKPMTVNKLQNLLNNSLGPKSNGEIEQFILHLTTPLWIGRNYAKVSPRALISVSTHEDMVVLRTQE